MVGSMNPPDDQWSKIARNEIIELTISDIHYEKDIYLISIGVSVLRLQ